MATVPKSTIVEFQTVLSLPLSGMWIQVGTNLSATHLTLLSLSHGVPQHLRKTENVVFESTEEAQTHSDFEQDNCSM